MISADTITAINCLAQEGRPFCFALNFEGDEAIVGTDEDWKRRGILFQMGDFSNYAPAEIPLSPADWLPQPMPYEAYRRAYDVVHAHLLAGNSYLVNLAFVEKLHRDGYLVLKNQKRIDVSRVNRQRVMKNLMEWSEDKADYYF